MTLHQKFKGRHHELELLDELWETADPTLLVLYSRRRVGKTRLMTHWVRERQVRAIYWLAEPSSAQDQLRSFSQTIYNFANPDEPDSDSFTYATWQQAWEQVAALAQTERLALILDEFTTVLKINPDAANDLQNMWDHSLTQSNLFLTICGSHLALMQRHLLSEQAPLYGRATRQLHLQPIPFGYIQGFLVKSRPIHRVAIYSIFGGIPAYWQQIKQLESFRDILSSFLELDSLMQVEAYLLLQDFIQDPHNYAAILRAIARGNHTQKAICTRTGLAQGHVSKYLSVLQDAGFVERQIPIMAGPKSRNGRYYITDPYLRFYFRFLADQQARLALGEGQLVLDDIATQFSSFIDNNTLPELCREWLLQAGARGETALAVEQVGGFWSQQTQVEVAGFHPREKTMILGACTLHDEGDVALLHDLIDKSAAVVPKTGKWRVAYVALAHKEWSEDAHQLAADKQQLAAFAKGNWQPVALHLLNLAQLDADLHRWARPE